MGTSSGHRNCTHGTHKVRGYWNRWGFAAVGTKLWSDTKLYNFFIPAPHRKSGSQHGIPEIYGQKHVRFIRKPQTGGPKSERHGSVNSLTPSSCRGWSRFWRVAGRWLRSHDFVRKTGHGLCLDGSLCSSHRLYKCDIGSPTTYGWRNVLEANNIAQGRSWRIDSLKDGVDMGYVGPDKYNGARSWFQRPL